MKLFKSDIQAAARADLQLMCAEPVADPTGWQRAALEADIRDGNEAHARATAATCSCAHELRHLFACADRVTAELGEVPR